MRFHIPAPTDSISCTLVFIIFAIFNPWISNGLSDFSFAMASSFSAAGAPDVAAHLSSFAQQFGHYNSLSDNTLRDAFWNGLIYLLGWMIFALVINSIILAVVKVRAEFE